MSNLTLSYSDPITATFADENSVTSPFSICSGDSEWNDCILKKKIDFNGTGATSITKDQIMSFFSGSGTVTVGSVSKLIRLHMINNIMETLNLDDTKNALKTAYNSGKSFNQKIESVSYDISTSWNNNLNAALNDSTDIVTIPLGITKFRFIFYFTASGFSKTVGIEWDVVSP